MPQSEATKLLTRFCAHEDGLPQDAPTSPRLSNLVNYRFDARIAAEEGYRVHGRKKTRIRRRHHRQVVTGLVVHEKVNLPRETRRY